MEVKCGLEEVLCIVYDVGIYGASVPRVPSDKQAKVRFVDPIVE